MFRIPQFGCFAFGRPSVQLAIVLPPTISPIAIDDIVNQQEQGTVLSGFSAPSTTVALIIAGNTRAVTLASPGWIYSLTAADITAMGQGAETITVVQTDSRGNVQTATRSLSVDTVAPATPVLNLVTDTGSSNSDRITTDGRIRVTSLDPLAVWEYTPDAGATWSPITRLGLADLLPSQLSGTLNGDSIRASISFTVVDWTTSVANEITAWLIILDGTFTKGVRVKFTVNTSNQLQVAVLSTAFANGNHLADWVTTAKTTNSIATSDTTGGYGVNVLRINNMQVGTGYLTTGQTLLQIENFILPNGVYSLGTVAARQTDVVGNNSPNGTIATLTVDTSLPSALTLAMVTDTGSSNSDRITTDGRIRVTGAEPSSSLEYSQDTGATWSSITRLGLTDLLPSQLAGTLNGGFVLASIPFTVVDWTTSVANEITAWLIIVDSGFTKGVRVKFTTNTSNQLQVNVLEAAFAGGNHLTDWAATTKTSNSIATSDSAGGYGVNVLRINNMQVGTGYLTTGQTLLQIENFVLPNGTYTTGQVLARQIDVAGNTSPNSTITALTVDTAAPATTVTISGALSDARWANSNNSIGSVLVVNRASNARPTIPVTLSSSGGVTFAGWFKFNGVLAGNETQLLHFITGVNRFEVFLNASGVVAFFSNAVNTSTVTLDTQWHHFAVTTNGTGSYSLYMDGVQIITVTGGQSLVSGTYSLVLGNHVSQARGFGGSIAQVAVWQGIQATADLMKDPSVLPTNQLVYAPLNETSGSVITNLAVGGTNGSGVTGDANYAVGGAYSLGTAIANNSATTDTTPTLSGTISAALVAGQTVEILDGASVIGAATVTSTSWRFTPTSALSQGAHAFSGQIVNVSGNRGATGTAFNLTVDTVSQVTINTVAGDDVIGASEQTSVITGSNEPGAAVSLVIAGNTKSPTVTASSWGYTLTAGDITAMGQGGETITVVQTDALGNTASVTKAISVQTASPEPTIAPVATDDIFDRSSESVSQISGTSTNGAAVFVRVEENASVSFSGATGPNWSIAYGNNSSAPSSKAAVYVTEITPAGVMNSATRRYVIDPTGLPAFGIDPYADLLQSVLPYSLTGDCVAGSPVSVDITHVVNGTRVTFSSGAATVAGTRWSYPITSLVGASDFGAVNVTQGGTTISSGITLLATTDPITGLFNPLPTSFTASIASVVAGSAPRFIFDHIGRNSAAVKVNNRFTMLQHGGGQYSYDLIPADVTALGVGTHTMVLYAINGNGQISTASLDLILTA